VPDPKSQVEQITIALIYKFMDDMDRQSEELGGKATFFTGEFKKYRWAQLLDKRFGGHERLLLYAEGIEKMNENKNIPQLFRDIFKGVFLPYRDPETLNLFLKEIDGFTYDHSERLGDAFEYLLSVLGTQGDAGQFRTPRHIIDFIVAVVDPKKTETILDPACGTAGFLISAFKHILAAHDPSDLSLTPDERARLMTNFRGYDIAPDMVRLSRVNLYLHGFPNPTIHEYDALTSEERWDERCDVIMANPPFMTPKGGIRPHNRFSIRAKRSEVLFVDYIAEHLNPGGRAGVIVPEGIIFQSQNAYKALRKMLVENYLWAVVSLPAGVFNPYSGVKTSILFLDRGLVRSAGSGGSVLFLKVENDGFDLGAQRRPIEKNDLPAALKALLSWRAHDPSNPSDQPNLLSVPRARLLESPDINLSGDRYRVAPVRPSGKWPMVRLAEVCEEMKSGFACGPDEQADSGVPHLRPMNISEAGELVWNGTKFITELAFSNKQQYALQAGDVLFNNTNSKELVGKTCLVESDFRAGYSNHMTRLRVDRTRLTSRLLAFLLHDLWRRGTFLERCNKWVGQSAITELPLPPLDEQERIVAELEAEQLRIRNCELRIEESRKKMRTIVESLWE
jgi:type I restriction enzyme M protein